MMKREAVKCIIMRLDRGPGYTLEDTDLWGICNAIQHGLDDGYFEDNKGWAEAMLKRIRTLR